MDWSTILNAGWLSVVIALISLVVQLRKKRSRLSYEESLTPLLINSEEEEGRIKVFYDGHEIRDVMILKLELRNTGNVDIEKEHFVDPLVILFKNSNIFSAQILKSPLRIPDIDFLHDSASITIMPLLLHPRESITLKVVFTKLKGSKYSFLHGIKNINEIKKVASTDSGNLWFIIIGIIINCAIGFYWYTFGLESFPLLSMFLASVFGSMFGTLATAISQIISKRKGNL